MTTALALLGRQAISGCAFVGDAVAMLASAASHLARGRVGWRRVVQQMAIAGADSVPIATLTLFLVGLAWGWHAASYLVKFGATSYLGGGTAVAIARELGPALCGVVVAARVGAAFAAELGTMTITEQVDALRALAINPIYYLVVPRLLACTAMLPLLTMLADASGILGAYVVSAHFGISGPEYATSVQRWLETRDLLGGVGKTVVFGMVIALVGCRQGLRATGGAEGVGRAAISAVVVSIVLIYLLNFALTAIIFRY